MCRNRTLPTIWCHPDHDRRTERPCDGDLPVPTGESARARYTILFCQQRTAGGARDPECVRQITYTGTLRNIRHSHSRLCSYEAIVGQTHSRFLPTFPLADQKPAMLRCSNIWSI